MRPTLSFFPNKLKINTKKGTMPIYLRILFNRRKTEARLGMEVSIGDLAKWNEETMRLDVKQSPVNTLLNFYETRFQKFLVLNDYNLQSKDANAIKHYVLQIEDNAPVVLLDYCRRYQHQIQGNKELAEGTKKNYVKSVNHLDKFLSYYEIRTMKLTEFTPAQAAKFKDYLVADIPSVEKVGMTEVSAAAIIKRLKPILERAVFDELIQKNPFKGLKLRNKSPKRPKLLPQQICKLWKLDLSSLPRLGVYRDIFMFSVFTGLAYKDAISVRYSDLFECTSGDRCLRIRRAKTDIVTEIVLVIYALEIVKRLEKLPRRHDAILPYRSNKEINVNLKLLAEKVGITFNLSTHIARHTFRQMLGEAGIKNVGAIKRMMGHAGRDIDDIYFQVTESMLIDAKSEFESFLNRILNE